MHGMLAKHRSKVYNRVIISGNNISDFFKRIFIQNRTNSKTQGKSVYFAFCFFEKFRKDPEYFREKYGQNKNKKN